LPILKLEYTISQKPHTGINLDKLSKDNKWFEPLAYRISLCYFSDTKDKLDDINDICDDIRDKGYQVNIEFHQSNISDRDIGTLIESKGLGNPIERRQNPMSYGMAMDMRSVGICPESARYTEHWVHDKSFIKESIHIHIKNVHELTSIEKKYADGKVLEYTKDSLNYELVTKTTKKEYQIIIDDDIEETIERCKDFLGADTISSRNWDKGVDFYLTIFREIL
jgi:hypothetical protein